MQFTGTKASIGLELGTNEYAVTFYTKDKEVVDQILELKDIDKIDIEAKKHRNKRSLDANGYLWVLIGKLAKKVNLKKTEVYRKHISEVGKYLVYPIPSEEVERFIEAWESRGLGWVCEKDRDSKIEGYSNILSYYGSSFYNTKEMTRLIDSVVEDCKEQGIETMPPAELKSMKESWGK